MTTAVAASFFGVTGTLFGAAFGSVVSSVAAAVYTASFKTAGTRIKATRSTTSQPGEGDDPQDPSERPPRATGSSVPPPPGLPVSPLARALRPRWRPVAVLSGFVFLVTVGAISTTEMFLGHPINDSQNTGTSIGTAFRGDPPTPTRTRRSTRTATETSSPQDGFSDGGPARTGPTQTDATSVEGPSPSDTATAVSDGTTSQPGDLSTTSQPAQTHRSDGTPTSTVAPNQSAGGGIGSPEEAPNGSVPDGPVSGGAVPTAQASPGA